MLFTTRLNRLSLVQNYDFDAKEFIKQFYLGFSRALILLEQDTKEQHNQFITNISRKKQDILFKQESLVNNNFKI
jgi:hypothetical protein